MSVRLASQKDFETLLSFYASIGRSDPAYFEDCVKRGCDILVAEDQGAVVGSAVINWTPKYRFYQKFNVPEIQDVFIAEAARQKGHATALIGFFEARAQEKGRTYVGVSVALTSNYGPAHKLYSKLGYVPDGNGVTYDRAPVERYRSYPLDDDLCLMMVKEL